MADPHFPEHEPGWIPPAKVKANPETDVHEYPLPDIREKGRVECYFCHEWLPFDRFESLTDPLCYHCRSTASERELQELKERIGKTFTKELIDAGTGRKALDHIENFLAELMYDFGGMRCFVKTWAEQLKIAFEKAPGSKTNLDQCRSIAKLVMDCNKLQHQEDVLDLSDEQLRVKKELALMDMLTSAAGDPHRRRLLVELLRTGGAQITDIPGLPQYTKAESHAN